MESESPDCRGDLSLRHVVATIGAFYTGGRSANLNTARPLIGGQIDLVVGIGVTSTFLCRQEGIDDNPGPEDDTPDGYDVMPYPGYPVGLGNFWIGVCDHEYR